MSALEREIIEKFHQLDKDAQQRVQEQIVHEANAVEQPVPSTFDYDTWVRDMKKLRQQIRESHSNSLPPIDVVGLLRDIRDGEDE